MSDELIDFHVLIRPTGPWEFDADKQKGKTKAEVVHVYEGLADALIVGKARFFGIFKADRKNVATPGYGDLKDAATEPDGRVLEVKGYTQPGGTGQYGAIYYHTVQKARVFTGELPQGAQAAPGGPGATNGPSGTSHAFTNEDRARIVATSSLKLAVRTVLGDVGVHGMVSEVVAEVGTKIQDWARWYAERTYTLGQFILASEDEWTGKDQPQPEPEPAAEAPADDWSQPQPRPNTEAARASGDF